MANYDYDMLVIGSGPAGQRAAIQAAKLDKRVAIVERKETVRRSGGERGYHSQQAAPGAGAVW